MLRSRGQTVWWVRGSFHTSLIFPVLSPSDPSLKALRRFANFSDGKLFNLPFVVQQQDWWKVDPCVLRHPPLYNAAKMMLSKPIDFTKMQSMYESLCT